MSDQVFMEIVDQAKRRHPHLNKCRFQVYYGIDPLGPKIHYAKAVKVIITDLYTQETQEAIKAYRRKNEEPDAIHMAIDEIALRLPKGDLLSYLNLL